MVPSFQFFFVVVISLFFASCSELVEEKVFGGSENFEIVEGASSVLATRIDSTAADDTAFYYDYSEIGNPVALDSSVVGKLKALLKERGSYDLKRSKPCEPVPGVKLTFTDDTKSLDIFLCFECNILIVMKDKKRIAHEDFDPMRQNLVTVAKLAFPNDKEITSL